MEAMSSAGVHQGIIITTGNVHRNATEYLIKLHSNTSYRIKFLLIVDSMNPKSWPILIHIKSIDSNEPILAPK